MTLARLQYGSTPRADVACRLAAAHASVRSYRYPPITSAPEDRGCRSSLGGKRPRVGSPEFDPPGKPARLLDVFAWDAQPSPHRAATHLHRSGARRRDQLIRLRGVHPDEQPAFATRGRRPCCRLASLAATTLGFLGTAMAFPTMRRLWATADEDEALLGGLFDRFARWGDFSAAWHSAAFIALIGAMVVATGSPS